MDLVSIRSCKVHKGYLHFFSNMRKNVEQQNEKVEFKAPLIVAPTNYNILNELKDDGGWEELIKKPGFEFDDTNPKAQVRLKYGNLFYLERTGCKLCMGKLEKAPPADTKMKT